MKKQKRHTMKAVWITFTLVFVLSLSLVLAFSVVQPAQAAPAAQSGSNFVGSATCAACHQDTHTTWSGTRHSQAFSSPIFQQDWIAQGSSSACLECHTTGFDATTGQYNEEGVACEACHGPLQAGHPDKQMPITPDATLCARCHKTTTDEWRASKHGQINLNCEACHNSHSQEPRAESANELCGNCHKDTGSSFTHGTHASAGLQCSDCHMASTTGASMTGGLFATGHTFTVGSEACINCHRDTVHTRDTIMRLSGQTGETVATVEELQVKLDEANQTVQTLQTESSVRLYTGLIQGAIVGLITGGVAAWVVSRRIRVVEVEE